MRHMGFDQKPTLRRGVLLLVLLTPLSCALFLAGWALSIALPGLTIRIDGRALLLYSLALVAVTLPAAALALWSLRPGRRRAQIDVLLGGFEPGDQALVADLFPNSSDVRLLPLGGGYSGAAVFEAQSWAGAAIQRPSVIKVGSLAKIQPEVDNYERYVKEYVGNTAVLLNTARGNGRLALRWAYAGFSGGTVQTLADYAASGQPLAPVVEELFSSQSTLGLLLSSPRREPHRTLYQDYSWAPTEWQRILDAAHALPGDLSEPLAALQRVAEWYYPEHGAAYRAQRSFDAPVAIVHGDLNSRNVLLDARGTIFVIDFAHTMPGHLLRDFARLEAELLLVVDQPSDHASLTARVAQAETLLRSPSGGPARTLRDILGERPPAPALPAGVLALRRRAHDFAGPWLNEPAEQYVLSLLHATLDTLRYAQCGPFAKQAALRIGQRLIEALRAGANAE